MEKLPKGHSGPSHCRDGQMSTTQGDRLVSEDVDECGGGGRGRGRDLEKLGERGDDRPGGDHQRSERNLGCPQGCGNQGLRETLQKKISHSQNGSDLVGRE